MKNTFYLILAFLSLHLLLSCKKDTSPSIPPPDEQTSDFAEHFGEEVISNFIGTVVDQQNYPISGVLVKIGAQSTHTDNNGVFVLKDISTYEYFAYMTATKTGYILGSRAIAPTSGLNEIRIMMLPADIAGTVNSGATGSVSLPNGSKVTFDGDFKTSAGLPYSGPVQVVINHLDPTDIDFTEKMPGMLFARTEDEESRVLESYGMTNIELLGAAGEKLQPANSAQVEFPITASQQASAPSTIPLWHFDDELGYWIEEGFATRQGNKYIGNLAHFSWWNCDLPHDWILLKLRFVDQNGNPLSNLSTSLSNGGALNTNSNGEAGGLVPKNVSFTLTVHSNNDCNTLLHTQVIGPFSSDTDLQDIVINTNNLLGSNTYKRVFGMLKDCDDNLVNNGYVQITQGSHTQIVPTQNGAFNANIIACNNSILTLIGIDLDNGNNTGVNQININANSEDLGTLYTCQTEAEGISIHVIDLEEVRYVNTNLSATITGNTIQISGGTSDSFSLFGNNASVGTFTTASGFEIAGDVLTEAGHGGGASMLSNFNITYNVLRVGAVGQYIDIVFNGTYDESVQTSFDPDTQMPTTVEVSRTVNGIIRVLRQ